MEEVGRYLYRGISEETHGRNEGLQPKGTSFCRGIVIGEREDGGSDVVITNCVQHPFQDLDVARFIINDQYLGVGEFGVSG